MTPLATAMLAFATFGTAATAAVLDPTCQDLAGQGFVCADVVADPASGVDVDVVAYLEPTVPPLPEPPVAVAAAAAPTCQDLAGQGSVCADVVADPASGVDVDVVVYVEPEV